MKLEEFLEFLTRFRGIFVENGGLEGLTWIAEETGW